MKIFESKRKESQIMGNKADVNIFRKKECDMWKITFLQPNKNNTISSIL